MKAITFYNFTDSDFSWTWDGTPYLFPAKQRFMMEDWKAVHFAKHLANHVLNSQGKSVSDPSRAELMRRAMPVDEEIIAKDASELGTKLLNTESGTGEQPKVTQEESELSTSKPAKAKGGKAKAAKQMDEEEFEGK